MDLWPLSTDLSGQAVNGGDAGEGWGSSPPCWWTHALVEPPSSTEEFKLCYSYPTLHDVITHHTWATQPVQLTGTIYDAHVAIATI